MRFPILVLHITAGTLGMLSGFAAMALRKGSRRHSIVGDVFVVSMLALALSGTYLAVLKSQPGNILGGTFTFYLVVTAWMAARRGDSRTGLFDWTAFLIGFAVAAVEITFGFQAWKSPTGLRYDYPPGPYLIMGSVAALAVIGDIRMLVRRGITGTPRVARHLWRMCFAQFIAAASIFLARQDRFPAFLRKTGVLAFLSVLPLLVLIFWLIRVRVSTAYKKKLPAVRSPQVGTVDWSVTLAGHSR
jgi:uncharacterized membrane protein